MESAAPRLRPCEIADEWQHIEKGLSELAKLDGSKNYKKKIRDACLDGRAFLFVSEGGFIVLEPVCDLQELGCNIWAAWSKSGNAINRYHDQIISIAHFIGAQYLEFQTKRKAFGRIAPELGYQKLSNFSEYDIWRKSL